MMKLALTKISKCFKSIFILSLSNAVTTIHK